MTDYLPVLASADLLVFVAALLCCEVGEATIAKVISMVPSFNDLMHKPVEIFDPGIMPLPIQKLDVLLLIVSSTYIYWVE